MNPVKKFSTLIQLIQFMRPYRKYWIGAMIALLCTAGVTLAIGQGVKLVIDNKFGIKAVCNIYIIPAVGGIGIFNQDLNFMGTEGPEIFPVKDLFVPYIEFILSFRKEGFFNKIVSDLCKGLFNDLVHKIIIVIKNT